MTTTDHVMLCYVYTTRKLCVEDPKRSHTTIPYLWRNKVVYNKQSETKHTGLRGGSSTAAASGKSVIYDN